MKGIKELPRNSKKQQQESSDQSQVPESSVPQQSAQQSQLRSSDYVSVSNEYVHDSQVGYGVGNYKMQKILFRRWNLQKRTFEYLIKWVGYSSNQCTWQTCQDILREPCLQLKDLGKKTMLPIFERTHGKTFIYDEVKNKNIRQYNQNEKNHLKYAPKELIQQMQKQMEQLYGGGGSKQEQKNQNKEHKSKSQSVIKLESESIISQVKSSRNSMHQQSNEIQGFHAKNIIIEKLIYFPLEFELKISIRAISNPQIKRLLTCHQMMSIHPETAIMCYKIKLAFIQKWKRQNLPNV